MYYKTGNIELNSTTHSVLRDGKAVSLTPLEFALLEHLMRHPNRLCSRTEIIDRVWGQRFRYDTGTIDVHLNAIRRKLGFTRNRRQMHRVPRMCTCMPTSSHQHERS